MIDYAPIALRHIRELREHYEDRDRLEAIVAMNSALSEAERKIAQNPASGLPAPRPYPQLARPGRRWLKSGRYWIAYTDRTRPQIIGVFFETADIPNRI